MKRKKKAVALIAPTQSIDTIARDVEMFKKWMGGVSKDTIAKEYELNVQAIYDIARRNDWKGKRRQIKDAVFAEVLEQVKDRAVDTFELLSVDLGLLKKAVHGQKKKRQMSKEERQYALKFLELCMHEQKLAEGKPTSIVNGDQEVKLILPKGVEDAWVIPPDPRLTIERETPATARIDLSPEDIAELVEKEKRK